MTQFACGARNELVELLCEVVRPRQLNGQLLQHTIDALDVLTTVVGGVANESRCECIGNPTTRIPLRWDGVHDARQHTLTLGLLVGR